MNILIPVILIVSSCLLSNASDWKEYGDVGGYMVHTRSESDSNIRGVKAVGVINANMLTMMAHLRDIAGAVEWIPDLKVKYITKDLGDTAATTYSVNGMPWPLSDRDMLVHNSLKLDKQKKLLYVLGKSVDDEAHPPNSKYERAKITYANMGFRPISEQKTYVELTIFADPGGMIPSFAVNYYQKRWPTKFLKALEHRTQTKPIPARPGLKLLTRQLLKEMDLPGDFFPEMQQVTQTGSPSIGSDTSKHQ